MFKTIIRVLFVHNKINDSKENTNVWRYVLRMHLNPRCSATAITRKITATVPDSDWSERVTRAGKFIEKFYRYKKSIITLKGKKRFILPRTTQTY